MTDAIDAALGLDPNANGGFPEARAVAVTKTDVLADASQGAGTFSADSSHSRSWQVTFVGVGGDVPPMGPVYLGTLNGTAATLACTDDFEQGSVLLDGSFSLTFADGAGGTATIPHAATAAEAQLASFGDPHQRLEATMDMLASEPLVHEPGEDFVCGYPLARSSPGCSWLAG